MTDKQAPTVIWLQYHGDADPSEFTGPIDLSEVTWCKDQVFDYDVKYIRADLVADRAKGE